MRYWGVRQRAALAASGRLNRPTEKTVMMPERCKSCRYYDASDLCLFVLRANHRRGCPVSETCKEFSPAPVGRALGQQTYRQQLTYEYKLHRLELEDEYGYYR